VPPIPVNGARISCDGGPSPERGHPIVYINLDGDKPKCVPLPFTAFQQSPVPCRVPVARACRARLCCRIAVQFFCPETKVLLVGRSCMYCGLRYYNAKHKH
jgi:uncharacterized Zn-finger protein